MSGFAVLSDQKLREAYVRARELKLDVNFLRILENELLNRNLGGFFNQADPNTK